MTARCERSSRFVEPLRLAGEIDLAVVSAFRERLEEHIRTTTGDVVVDCVRLQFIDSSGVRVLVGVQQRLLAPSGRRLLLGGVSPTCRRVFEVLGLAEIHGVELL